MQEPEEAARAEERERIACVLIDTLEEQTATLRRDVASMSDGINSHQATNLDGDASYMTHVAFSLCEWREIMLHNVKGWVERGSPGEADLIAASDEERRKRIQTARVRAYYEASQALGAVALRFSEAAAVLVEEREAQP